MKMKMLKFIFGIPALLFGILGLAGVLSYDIASPVMFVLLGLTLLSIAKERHDAGNKRDSGLYGLLGVIILADTIFSLF